MGGSSTAEGSLGWSLWGHGWEGGGPGVSGCSSRERGTIWVVELVWHYFVPILSFELLVLRWSPNIMLALVCENRRHCWANVVFLNAF